ncbi:hypothetical protein HKO22_02985 [Peptoniphilus sp. AGMB00490]|uniref:Uncharacterized protein n=1 Tax=Peptoniphilus faecalis TaxID=2731255 RepID=A0A848RH02_9FIRM|nr:hypothetical protein [Peptoniphilus faecalis]NMW84709.1 hypothetical protein [Peptoniphilus faecalis]
MLKCNIGFEQTCEEEMKSMLDTILDDIQTYEGIVWDYATQKYFEYNFYNGTRTYSTEASKQNLCLWQYEDSNLYCNVLKYLEDAISISYNVEQKELFYVREGVQILLMDILDTLNIDSGNIISPTTVKVILDFLKD